MTHGINTAELRKRFDEEIADAETSVQSLEALLAPVESDCGIGRMSSSNVLADRGATEAILAMQRERLRQLKSALASLEDPDFGLCQRCGAGISAERLLAVPESRLCSACKYQAPQ